MTKYERLGVYLRQQGRDVVPMTFTEIERVVGTKLPNSQKHQAWWSNSTSNNVMTRVWLDAGYRTEQVDVERRRLVFRKVREAQTARGMQERGRMFAYGDESKASSGLKPRRSPLFGALKGLITIAPGWDLTRPALDPEELAEWEASLERKADLIEQGLAHKPSGKHQ